MWVRPTLWEILQAMQFYLRKGWDLNLGTLGTPHFQKSLVSGAENAPPRRFCISHLRRIDRIASGKHTKSSWTWPSRSSGYLPINSMVDRSSSFFVNVYQAGYHMMFFNHWIHVWEVLGISQRCILNKTNSGSAQTWLFFRIMGNISHLYISIWVFQTLFLDWHKNSLFLCAYPHAARSDG